MGPYGARNYVAPLKLFTPYRNFSDRTDYIISEKLRYTGRVSLFRTPIAASNPTESDLVWLSDRGSNRHATQVTSGVTWVQSPNRVIDANFAYYGFVDESNPSTDFQGYESLWANSSWYKTMFDSGVIPVTSPGMRITHGDGGSIMSSYSSGIGTNGPYWKKRPWQDFETIKVAQQQGSALPQVWLRIAGLSLLAGSSNQLSVLHL